MKSVSPGLAAEKYPMAEGITPGMARELTYSIEIYSAPGDRSQYGIWLLAAVQCRGATVLHTKRGYAKVCQYLLHAREGASAYPMLLIRIYSAMRGFTLGLARELTYSIEIYFAPGRAAELRHMLLAAVPCRNAVVLHTKPGFFIPCERLSTLTSYAFGNRLGFTPNTDPSSVEIFFHLGGENLSELTSRCIQR